MGPCLRNIAIPYPLLFFRGKAGWGKDLSFKKSENDEEQPSLYFYARQQIMKNPIYPLLPLVVQEWCCDNISRAEDMALSFIQRPEMQKRLSTFNNAIRPNNEDGTSVGKKLPLIRHPGHPARRKKAQVEGLAVVARRGKPHYFITMTCDKNWPEILANLEEGQNPMDRPDLCNRVFKMKLAELMKDIRMES